MYIVFNRTGNVISWRFPKSTRYISSKHMLLLRPPRGFGGVHTLTTFLFVLGPQGPTPADRQKPWNRMCAYGLIWPPQVPTGSCLPDEPTSFPFGSPSIFYIIYIYIYIYICTWIHKSPIRQNCRPQWLTMAYGTYTTEMYEARRHNKWTELS